MLSGAGSVISPDTGACIYTGCGVNAQASYLFDGKWEVALRNSTMLPEREVQSLVGYRMWNQSTLALTRYIIGHSLKVQLDLSYNHMDKFTSGPLDDCWSLRFQVELGL